MAEAARIRTAPALVQGDGLLFAFDTTGFGCVLLDGLGRVVRRNKQAEAYLGSAVHIRRKQLVTFDAQANETLERAIRHVLGTATEQDGDPVSVVLLPRASKRPLVLRAVPTQDASGGGAVRAALLIIDVEECTQPDSAILVGLFHLTPAEIRIARRLACGEGPSEIAANLGISSGTVRNGIKSLFHKTSTSRQAELVSLLAHVGRLQLPEMGQTGQA